MKLTCFYTSNFEPMAIRFLSGILDQITLECTNIDAAGVSGLGGGIRIWEFKTEALIKQARPLADGNDEICLFMDIDIAVYGELVPTVFESLANCDMVFQRECGSTPEQANIGVIAFRRSSVVRRFWEDVMRIVRAKKQWDQGIVNQLLADQDYCRALGIRFGFLPNGIWARSQLGHCVPVGQCLLHHANCAESLVDKWLQLNQFRPLFEQTTAHSRNAFDAVISNLTRLTWTFGSLGTVKHFGSMTFDEDGYVHGYEDDNEYRVVATAAAIGLMSRSGHCTAVFNEFYFDSHRKKLAAVGPVFLDPNSGQKESFHYLFASL